MQRILKSLLFLGVPLMQLGAQGWIDVDRPASQLRLPPQLVRVSSDVHAVVDGRIARFEVTERFKNIGSTIGEGTYLYPLPGEAVFSDFSLFQGERELKGEMMAAAQARSIYEGIVRRLKDPALLTLVGHGLIKAQVFPVQPGETRTVTLRFTELLGREADALRLRYAAGDRGDANVTMAVDVHREAEFATPYSPTHQMSNERRNGDLRIAVRAPVHGDVDVVLPFRHGLVGGTVITHAEPGEDGFALLFLSPPAAGESAPVGRDLTLVVDVSGSMAGEKIDQAKSALRQALDALRPRDRFRLIAFSSGVHQFREGFTAATPTDLADARRFVNELQATGGTNLEGAIEAALAEPANAERLAMVMLMTDGIPSVGEQAPDRLAANAAAHIGRSRIFTVGVGHDVNTYLLDRLAVDGRGTATYVAPGADVGDAVGGLLSKLSRPALVDLRIVDAPVRFQEQAPAQLPDLFYGEELVVLARYHGDGNGPVVIEGTRNGARERFTINATFARHESGNDFVAPLWAARRIGELTRQIRIEGSTPVLVAAVKDLGLRYGILTEYTAYLVQEPGTSVAASPAPQASGARMAREMTGATAFDAAKASASLSASSSLQSANAAVSGRLDEVSGRGGRGAVRGMPAERGELRRAGGTLFTWRNGAWTDLSIRDSAQASKAIAPFSNAYFALVAARPALKGALAVGSPVTLAGKRIALKIMDGGATDWAAGELDHFLQEFDGR